MLQLNILYKPKKHFFKMNINELKEYVSNCKNIDSKNKKLIKKAGKKRKTRRRRKSRKRRKNTRRKKI